MHGHAMNSLKLRTTFSFLVLTLFLCAPGFAQPDKALLQKTGFSADRLQRLEGTFQGYVRDKQMAGSVIMLARRGKVVYQRAFGLQYIASGAPMQVDTIFSIASQ